MADVDLQLLQTVARAICSHTDLRKPEDPDPIFDQPDDLIWLRDSEGRVHPAPRWILYEQRARVALEAIGGPLLVRALASIIEQVQRGRSADRLVVERALDEIDRLARKGLAGASIQI